MRLRPIYSKKFDYWVLCHDQPCEKGQTSAVARIYCDEATAHTLCAGFNASTEQNLYLDLIKDAFGL